MSFSMADSPCSGAAECAARPSQPAARGGCRAWPSPSRLSVGSPLIRIPAGIGNGVGRDRTVAAPLFADDEEQPDAPFARRPSDVRPPRPAPPGSLSHRTRRGQSAGRPRRDWESTAARSRSAWRTRPPDRRSSRGCWRSRARPAARGPCSRARAAAARASCPASASRPVVESMSMSDRAKATVSSESIARAPCARRFARRGTSR